MPQPGKVRIQVRTISRATPQFTYVIRFAAPTPIIAVVFVCVVLTGTPVSDENSRQAEAAMSAENPWYFSSFTMSMPTALIMR